MEQKKKTEITRQKILDAAEKEFSSLGIAAARVDSIAKHAGVNKQMIYAHFESKEGLYSTVLDRVYSRLSSYHERVNGYHFKGEETIRLVVEDYFTFLTENPSFVRLMLWENLNGARFAKTNAAPWFDGVKKILQEGIACGRLRSSLDLEQTVLSMNMFCFSAFSNVHTLSKLLGKDLHTDAALRQRAEHITEIFLRYVLEK